MDNVDGSTRDAAYALLGAGLSVIPVESRGKRPLVPWGEYQVRRATGREVDAWLRRFGPTINLGVVTGAVSRVVVVDADSERALDWIAARLPVTTSGATTTRGVHFYFAHPGRHIGNRARIETGDGRLAIDVRGDGGYVVCPPSVGPSNIEYGWWGAWPPRPETLPVFDPRWLQSVAMGSPAVESPPLRRARPFAARGASDRVARARAWLAKRDPAIEGCGGDAHTFSTACALARGFALTEVEALTLLEEWNEQCSPRWTRRELESKVRSALAYGVEPLGGRL